MPCNLYICGKDLDVHRFANATSLQPDKIRLTGEPRRPHSPNGEKFPYNLAMYHISKADFEEHKQQIQDALAFFRRHGQALADNLPHESPEFVYLDFGMDNQVEQTKITKTFIFPAELMLWMGILQCDLWVALYDGERIAE